MKPAVYLFAILCAALLAGGRHTHAGKPFSKSFQQITGAAAEGSSIARKSITKLFSSESGQTTDDEESIIAAEDDEDEKDFIGKQAPVVKPNTVVVTISALPPPVSSLSTKTYTPHDFSSLLRSCRYIAHRALLI